jgi:hypothetical protein
MYASAIIGAGALAAPSASWIYSQLPKWIKTGIDIGLTVDGARNFLSDNGVQKLIEKLKQEIMEKLFYLELEIY